MHLQKRIWRWRWRAAAGLLIIVIILLAPCHDASAHAFLDRSSPDANAVLPEPPPEVRIWFTEALEPAYTRAELFDADGNRIQTGESRLGDDPHELVLPLPDDLERGTYTVQWRNVSAVDGHPQAGYLPFTVGQAADVVVPVLPDEPPVSSSAGVVGTLGRWLGLIGVSTAVGAVVSWLLVVRPVIGGATRKWRRKVGARIGVLSFIGVASALAGSILLLLSQVMTASGALSGSAIGDLLTGTRFGYLWVLRCVLLLALAAVILRSSIWDEQGTVRARAWGLVLAGLALLPFSLVSHAAAQPAGRPAAIAVDWLHLAGSSVWVGGLLTLLVGLVLSRGLSNDARRAVYAAAIPRFSTVAISSVVILGLTGLYSAWLQVGNLHALRETDYGRTLSIKLVLLVPMLALGALNLLVTGPWMLRRARARVQFARSLLAEVVLGLAVLLVVGVLIGMPPARETLNAESGRSTFHFSQDGIHASLYVSPGTTGQNQYTVNMSGSGTLPEGTQVLLRVASAGDVEGVREIVLERQASTADRFEASGSELSVVGQWQLELIVRRPAQADWRVTTPIEIGRTLPEAHVPSPPPRFGGLTAAAAVLGAGAGIILLVAGIRRRGASDERRFVIEAGIGLVLISLVILLLSRVSTDADVDGNPVPMTAESVAAGQELFLQECAICHGESGYGDGQLATRMTPPPTDFREDHVDEHTDEELHRWLQNGIPGTAMPGFDDTLSDEEMWHLVNYVRSIRYPVDATQTP